MNLVSRSDLSKEAPVADSTSDEKDKSKRPSSPEPSIKSTASDIAAMFVQKSHKRAAEIPSLNIKLEKQDKKK